MSLTQEQRAFLEDLREVLRKHRVTWMEVKHLLIHKTPERLHLVWDADFNPPSESFEVAVHGDWETL